MEFRIWYQRVLSSTDAIFLREKSVKKVVHTLSSISSNFVEYQRPGSTFFITRVAETNLMNILSTNVSKPNKSDPPYLFSLSILRHYSGIFSRVITFCNNCRRNNRAIVNQMTISKFFPLYLAPVPTVLIKNDYWTEKTQIMRGKFPTKFR